MEVTIIGTGSIYSKSTCASLMIDKNILVDLGPGVIKQILKQGYDLRDIDTIFLTHLHGDHILDFPTFIINIEVLKGKHPINIYAPKKAKEQLLALLNIIYEDYFDSYINKYINFIELSDNKVFQVKEHEIVVKEVVHTGIESYGFIVDSTLGITGDASLCKGVEEIFNCSEKIVSDCSMIKGDIYHMGLDNMIELLKRNPKKEVITTHLREETKSYLQKQELERVSIIKDGFKFFL